MQDARVSVLIIDKMHESITPLLEEQGFRGDYRPDIQRSEILEILPNYEGLIVRSKTPIDAELLAQASHLRFIGRAGSGLDLIDLEAAEKRNIEVFNAPEGNRDAVAEHTLGMILSLLHYIHKADREVRQKIWNREANRGYELMNQTVAIIGYGNIGQEVAKRLRSFQCRILAFDKYKSGFGNDWVEESSLDTIYKEADIVTFHIPLSQDTHYLVNASYLQQFQKPIYLINTARGKLVELVALTQALKKNRIKGACLDVLENEKLDRLSREQQEAFVYLSESDKVILTPHVAGWTYESYHRINEVLVQKIQDCLLAKPSTR